MSPKEFWRLRPIEFWWLLEAKKPVKMYGRLTEHELAAMYADTYGDPDDPDVD